jgi:O-antigen ligase
VTRSPAWTFSTCWESTSTPRPGRLFGIGTLISAVGLLVAGVTTVRARRWTGWRRYAPLAVGVWLTAMIALVNTPALAVSVTLYGLLLLVLGVAVATSPAPAEHEVRAGTPRPARA